MNLKLVPIDDLDIPSPAEQVNKTGNSSLKEAVCWGFTGAVGGVGVTSLCVETALALLRPNDKTSRVSGQAPFRSVCVIDLDFENGMCANYLDTDPLLSPEILSGDPDRIDRTLLDAMCAHTDFGLTLLAAPNCLRGNDLVNPDVVVKIMDVACEMFDFIILDVPRLWRPWTHAAIGACDKMSMVTKMSIPCLHATVKRSAEYQELIGFERPINVILNKFERRTFRNSLRLSDAETVLKHPLQDIICHDPDIVREAINCGTPAGIYKADNRYSKDCRKIVESWLDEIKIEKASQSAN